MYGPVLNASLNTNFIPEAENIPAFPPVSIAGSQKNPPQTSTEGFDIVLPVPPQVGGIVATGRG